MTLTMVAAAYSFYFSAGKDTRSSLPFDFVIENDGTNARLFDEELAGQGIRFAHKRVEALQIRGAIREFPGRTLFDENTLLVMPAEQLLQLARRWTCRGCGTRSCITVTLSWTIYPRIGSRRFRKRSNWNSSRTAKGFGLRRCSIDSP